MAQVLPHFCPRCGAMIENGPQQRFCSRCHLDLAMYLAENGSLQASGQALPSASQAPQPPSSAQQFSSASNGGSGWVTPPRKTGRGRTGIVLMLVVALLLLGVAGYLSWSFFGPGIVQPAITTTAINTTASYANVALTVQTVQQSQSFVDDPNTATSGMVRLHLQAKNNATVPVSLTYTNIARLVLPGGGTVSPIYVKSNVSLAPSATQASMVDFVIPSGTKIGQLTLRLGAANEAQIDLPLTGHANMAIYAPQTTNLNRKLAYQGLDWVLVSATSQLSLDGQQASKGMRYVTMTFSVNNTLSQTAILGAPYSYMRLKVDNTTVSPTDSTLPTSFDAGATGKTGTVTFQAPQNATTLMLILLSQDGFDQATTNLQFQ